MKQYRFKTFVPYTHPDLVSWYVEVKGRRFWRSLKSGSVSPTYEKDSLIPRETHKELVARAEFEAQRYIATLREYENE